MKKLLFSVIAILVVGAAYVLGTFNASKVVNTPPASWTGNSASAEAWRELAVSMEAAGARVFAATTRTAEREQGLLYLAQLLGASLEMKLARGDNNAPQFTDWMSGYRKFLGDSPDAVYHTAQITVEHSYLVSGNRADTKYIGFMVYGKAVNGWNQAAANLSSEQIRFDDQGNFEILLSREKPENDEIDWLQLEDDSHLLMVRQYFHDPASSHKAQFSIRNLDPRPYSPIDDSTVADAMREANSFFLETLDGSIALMDMLSSNANNIDPPTSYSADFGGVFYPTLDNEYYGTWFSLAEDEALIIEGKVPEAPYWAVSLQNRWMQSMDYQHFQSALNNEQIETEAGRYRIVVSPHKPPSGNWLDTGGSYHGLLSIRYQLATEAEKPSLRVVRYDEL